MKNFTGIDAPYDEPEASASGLNIDTGSMPLEECV